MGKTIAMWGLLMVALVVARAGGKEWPEADWSWQFLAWTVGSSVPAWAAVMLARGGP